MTLLRLPGLNMTPYNELFLLVFKVNDLIFFSNQKIGLILLFLDENPDEINGTRVTDCSTVTPQDAVSHHGLVLHREQHLLLGTSETAGLKLGQALVPFFRGTNQDQD